MSKTKQKTCDYDDYDDHEVQCDYQLKLPECGIHGTIGWICNHLILGWIACPVYFFKCLAQGCNCNQLCIPLKRHCSPNGKNRRSIFAIPYVFEIVTILLCYKAYSFTPLFRGTPLAIIDRNSLLQEDVTFDPAIYPPAMAPYPMYLRIASPNIMHREFFNQTNYPYTPDIGNPEKHEGLSDSGYPAFKTLYTFFDRMMLEDWMTAMPWGFNITDTASHTTYARDHLFKPASAAMHFSYYDTPFYGYDHDLIVVSENCMCINMVEDLKVIAEAPSYWEFANSKLATCADSFLYHGPYFAYKFPSQCLYMESAFRFIDLDPTMTAKSYYDEIDHGFWYAFTILISRVLAMFFCRKELRMPGSQWLQPFWAFWAIFYSWYNGWCIRWMPLYGNNYDNWTYHNKWIYNYDKGIKPAAAKMIIPYAPVEASGKIFMMWEDMFCIMRYCMVACFISQLLSSEARCTDCTVGAYAPKYMKHHTRRQRMKKDFY